MEHRTMSIRSPTAPSRKRTRARRRRTGQRRRALSRVARHIVQIIMTNMTASEAIVISMSACR